jgi:hypothetical protein
MVSENTNTYFTCSFYRGGKGALAPAFSQVQQNTKWPMGQRSSGASSNFAEPSPHFGSSQLPDGSLQGAHFWVSRDLAPKCRNPPSLGAANMALTSTQ